MKHYVYIGLYTGHSLTSLWIRAWSWSKRSHVSDFLPPDENGGFDEVVEAWKKGVTRNHWKGHHKKGTIIDVYRMEVTKEQQEEYYLHSTEKVGKVKYDFWGVFAFPFRANWDNKDREFCSEMCLLNSIHIGMPYLERIEPRKVPPGLLETSPRLEHVVTLKV